MDSATAKRILDSIGRIRGRAALDLEEVRGNPGLALANELMGVQIALRLDLEHPELASELRDAFASDRETGISWPVTLIMAEQYAGGITSGLREPEPS